jgi:hypothetical protein
VLREHVADLADGPVPVVGQRLDVDRGSARAVALVHHFLERRVFAAAAPFLIARSIVSLAMLAPRALSTARRSRGFAFGSPPPIRAAC